GCKRCRPSWRGIGAKDDDTRSCTMTEIPRRTLGRTGLEVSTLGYGAMELRGAPTGPDLSDADAAALLDELLDAGVNFIDTSIDYGRSEDVIGDVIAGRR